MVDLAVSPLEYPGAAAERAILLLPRCEHRLRFSQGRRLGQARVEPCSVCAVGDGVGPVPMNVELMARNVADMDSRVAVVAIGSNASPTVMRAKLARAGCSLVVPMTVGVLGNVAVGHSAHVGVLGYMPAAPMRRAGATTPVVVSFLDERQLRAIDDTERNYDRVVLTEARHEVTLVLHERLPRDDRSDEDGPDEDEPGEQLSGLHLYRSHHGLLRIDEETMFFPKQVQVSGWLAAQRVAPWDSQDPADAAAHLAKDPALRARAFRAFRERDLVIDDGLESAEPGELSYRSTISHWPAEPLTDTTLRYLPTLDGQSRQGEWWRSGDG